MKIKWLIFPMTLALTGVFSPWALAGDPGSGVVSTCTLTPELLRSYSGEVFFPGVASVGGYNGTKWRSEAVLGNTGTTDLNVTLALIPRGQSSVSASSSFTVPAGKALRISDIYAALGAGSGAGLLKVNGGGDIWVRTYNQGAHGTFGQQVPGYDHAPYAAGEVVAFPIHRPSDRNTEFRSNLILYNMALGEATFHLQVGSKEKTTDVPAGTYAQINDVGQYVGAATGDHILSVWSENADWGGYIATVDPVTGDPTTVTGSTTGYKGSDPYAGGDAPPNTEHCAGPVSSAVQSYFPLDGNMINVIKNLAASDDKPIGSGSGWVKYQTLWGDWVYFEANGTITVVSTCPLTSMSQVKRLYTELIEAAGYVKNAVPDVDTDAVVALGRLVADVTQITFYGGTHYRLALARPAWGCADESGYLMIPENVTVFSNSILRGGYIAAHPEALNVEFSLDGKKIAELGNSGENTPFMTFVGFSTISAGTHSYYIDKHGGWYSAWNDCGYPDSGWGDVFFGALTSWTDDAIYLLESEDNKIGDYSMSKPISELDYPE